MTRFGEISPPVIGKFIMVYFIFGKMLSILWQICDIIGLIPTAANGQMLKNNLTICSHCRQVVRKLFGPFRKMFI